MCNYCKSPIKNSKSPYVFDTEDNTLLIKNVPCDECTHCGATFFSHNIMANLRSIAEELTDLVDSLTIYDYANIAN
ncbi:MAG: hypothetical protein ATN36_04800 [Epulopiscium sp. Nele67-Bin005]|nr:MAG: hypothetical protein ATN36_04800 [Epulopiscium sp. Nele67-Bin005]